MNTLRSQLIAQLARFDEDAFVALANRGLLRRAQKDLEKARAEVLEESEELLVLGYAEHRIQFDARGPSHAKCSCPAAGVCQHILAAALTLQGMADAATEIAPSADATDTPADPVQPLHLALLAISNEALQKHAGRPGYRWAWQFVQDMDLERDLTLAADRNIVIGFRAPRVTFRYMGGGLESLVADVESSQLAKQQVAAVLAYRRANGADLPAPEPSKAAQTVSLDLGRDHQLAGSVEQQLELSRKRLRQSATSLFEECVELGLSHLSPSMQERFSTLAVWAQGAEYYRLALLLRRIADHVEALLERAGDADEHRLFDEITIAAGLVTALESAARSGRSPVQLTGRARSRYDKAGNLELIGLGASAWRSKSGYVGLTMLFWSPADKVFFSCSDARPELQRGFDPVARYRAPGPWGGLGAPAMASGKAIWLHGAQINAQGRISASESTSANALPCPNIRDRLSPHDDWAALAESRGRARRSLLAEPDPMADWAVLAPAQFGTPYFDQARQVLCWPIMDRAGQRIEVELAYSKLAEHAIKRIEQSCRQGIEDGTWIVARLYERAGSLVADPLSLIRSTPIASDSAVDALFFDDAPASGGPCETIDGRHELAEGRAGFSFRSGDQGPVLVLRQCLQRHAERGWSEFRTQDLERDLQTNAALAMEHGYSELFSPLSGRGSVAARLLAANYRCIQYERLIGVDPVEL